MEEVGVWVYVSVSVIDLLFGDIVGVVDEMMGGVSGVGGGLGLLVFE